MSPMGSGIAELRVERSPCRHGNPSGLSLLCCRCFQPQGMVLSASQLSHVPWVEIQQGQNMIASSSDMRKLSEATSGWCSSGLRLLNLMVIMSGCSLTVADLVWITLGSIPVPVRLSSRVFPRCADRCRRAGQAGGETVS